MSSHKGNQNNLVKLSDECLFYFFFFLSPSMLYVLCVSVCLCVIIEICFARTYIHSQRYIQKCLIRTLSFNKDSFYENKQMEKS